MPSSQLSPAAATVAGVPLHPLVAGWFADRFGQPTEPQRLGWQSIAAGRNTLIAAPTGSGKTLAAFLWCLDRLLRESLAGELPTGTQVVYVSPLKALSNDIHRNLEVPLAELRDRARGAGFEPPPIVAGVRTGDTPTSQRAAMLRRPPHILVTTPESLYLLLTSAKSRESLRSVRTVIVDEIHALARDKRGSHLALSLARLDHACQQRPVRIGLSATQRPIDQIAQFLVGTPEADRAGGADCAIVDVGHARDLDLAVEVPPSELGAVCSHETWDEIYRRLTELVQSHRSTLIFVNTRRLAERVSHHLIELLGESAVASHHGSLSRQLRLGAEQRLKSGQLKAIVATASLEMGIDVGYLDLVCQIGSPRSIATFLQRVGRSGHSLGLVPRGRLFPLSRDELLECLALVRAVRRGRLDRIEIPRAPLDILAQQIVAAVAADPWNEDDLFALCRRAWPYRDLSRADFDAIVEMLGTGADRRTGRGAHLHRDRLAGTLRPRRGARITAITSGGAIPELADYRVVTAEDRTFVGTLNEDFAIESQAGDVFQLGNTSWRIRHVRGGEVVVHDAQGAPASVPFWLGEAPGRTIELSAEVADLRQAIAERIPAAAAPARPPAADDPLRGVDDDARELAPVAAWIEDECLATAWGAVQAARYVAAQQAAVGFVPTTRNILFERFFDEAGGTQLVIHAPLGARINRAWGLALRKRFCRSFDFELQASATDDGILLSLGPQHSFPIEALFKMLGTHNGRDLLVQALLAAPMFQTRFRWNATRALAVLRQRGGKKVPPYLQRHRADDLLAAVFPEQVGCLENHSGDVPIPDHPLVAQTVTDCLHEAMDVDGWLALLGDVASGHVELVARETREPSPFSHQIVNANPYAFLDGAPLEERRARAVALRRSLDISATSDLGWLDPQAIAQVRLEAQPLVRDADELHDALLTSGLVRADDVPHWERWFAELVAAGRATVVRRAECASAWAAAENWPLVRAALPDAVAAPRPALPAALERTWESAAAQVELVRWRMQIAGPTTATALAVELGLPRERADAALVALEGEGCVMRGRYTPHESAATHERTTDEIEWCDRRLLARIHRLTLDRLRQQIKPVEPTDFIRFLVAHQRLGGAAKWQGPAGVREVIGQLQGFEMPAGAWERRILPLRVAEYDPAWLDALAMSGELAWGRLRPLRRDAEAGASAARLTRAVPLSLVLREDLSWLLPREREACAAPLRSGGQLVLEALSARGALFYHDLRQATGLLPSQLDDALFELAMLGLVSADAFGPVRSLMARPGSRRGARRAAGQATGKLGRITQASGRWSLFPGDLPRPTNEEYVERWARQLLRRWGVLFRDLLARDSAAPPWGELAPTLRRMEARGEIRGGRFVSGVGGEQFAAAEHVDRLRRARDQEASDEWLVISAADPLNLEGIVTAGPRLPAKQTNSIALRNGAVLATLDTGTVEFRTELPPAEAVEVARKLRRTG